MHLTLKLVLRTDKICVYQVRESIGVTLSVLCSNLRLHAHFADFNLHEDGNLRAGSWDKLLVERASEVVANIQHASQSDNMVIAEGSSSEKGFSSSDLPNAMKWMETVLFFKLVN